MKIVIDTHTHTISSGHAYSTVTEMALEASKKGIKAFVITDHGPSMGGAPHLYHFGNMKVIPQELYGVRLLKGVEANIIDYEGNVDMPNRYLKMLDFCLASFHDICIDPSKAEEHTNALMNVIKNPFIDAIAHPGNPQFPADLEKVILCAKEHNKLIEINNQSFVVRTGSEENCKNIALICKKYGVRVVCGSDAHISFDVGNSNRVIKLLEEVGMPEELVLNASYERFMSYIDEKKKINSK